MNKFQKPFISNPGILNSKPTNHLGYVTNDGVWAAVPFHKNFIIIHNGKQDIVCKTYKQSVDYIKKQIKLAKTQTATLEQFL